MKHPERYRLWDSVMAVFAVITIIFAWVAGMYLSEKRSGESLAGIIPGADSFEPLSEGVWAAYKGQDADKEFLFYLGLGEGNGYGGPMKLVVIIDTAGIISDYSIVDHKETPSFYKRVTKSNLISGYKGKNIRDNIFGDKDIDVISRATCTSTGMINALREGSHNLSIYCYGLLPVKVQPAGIVFGFPEIILLVLFIISIIAGRRNFRYTKILRWTSMLTGLIVLGFIYNSPLTIAKVNAFLLGYFPPWETGLYWYILFSGIVFIILINNKNPYCQWFCPFGATQECLALVGDAKSYKLPGNKRLYIWIQRSLAWTAILLALVFRDPGLTSYEVFGGLFAFIGSSRIFILLGMILILSVFVNRPWCNYLCPLRPVTDFIRLLRNRKFYIWK